MDITIIKYKKIDLTVTNKYTNQIISFGSVKKTEYKPTTANTFDDFFNSVEIKKVDVSFIYANTDIYPDDNVDIVKKKIEKNGKIPYKYQLLYFTDTRKPLGYEFIGENIKLNQNLIMDRKIYGEYVDMRYKIHKWRDMEVIDIRDMIPDLEEINIDKTYNNLISIYFPLISMESFRNMIYYDKFNEKNINYKFSDMRSELYRITEKDYYYTFGKINMISEIQLIKFRKPINLKFIFNNFNTDKTKYSNLILKIDDNNIYKKYNKQVKSTFSDIPNIQSLVVANNTQIFENGKIINNIIGKNNDIIKRISNLIINNDIESTTLNYNLLFNILIPFSINYVYLRRTLVDFFDIVQWKPVYKMRQKRSLEFYYRGVNFYDDNLGIRVNVSGENLLTLKMYNVDSIEDGKKIGLFMLRILHLYTFKWAKKIKFTSNKINTTRMKNYDDIDPVLFNYNKYIVDGSPYNIYTRICQKNRQPLVFDVDSNIFKYYILKHKPKNIVYNKNYTYPSKTMAYISSNENYPYISYIHKSKHPLGYNLPCAVKKDPSDTKIFKEATGKKYISKVGKLTNVYYVKKYNPQIKLENMRVSYLPDKLNKLFNGGVDLCIIDKNVIKIGAGCHFLVGSRSDNTIRDVISQYINIPADITKDFDIVEYVLHEHKTFIFIYTEFNNVINIVTHYNIPSMINIMKHNRTLFIVKSNNIRYNIIKKVSSIKPKKYKNIIKFKPESEIILESINILNMKYKPNDMIKFLQLIKKYKQILDNDNMVEHIMIDEVILPIIPISPNKLLPIIKNSNHVNKISDIIILIKRYNIKFKNIIVDINDKQIGVNVHYPNVKNRSFIILFEPTSIKTKLPRDELFINTQKIVEKWGTDIDTNLEIYKLLMLYITYYINKPTKKFRIVDKTEIIDTPFYQNDYNLLVKKKYQFMDFFKENKLKLYNIKKQPSMYKFIYNLIKPHVVFSKVVYKLTKNTIRKLCPTSFTTVVNQCENDKLRINKNMFENFMKLISYQLVNNFIIRQKVLDNELENIINNNEFMYNHKTEMVIKL